MNCSKCGKEMRIGTEQVGIDSKKLPVFHRFGYCDVCMLKTDLDFQPQKKENKKDSTLSIIAVVLSIFTVTYFFGFIIGLIDLCMNNQEYKHTGSWFAVIFGIIATIVFGGYVII